TGWRVAGQSAWLHAWVGERATCYAVEPDRKADALEAVLGLGWAGKMTHDGFSSYDRFTQALHQQCLGHVLRRLRELAAQARRGAGPFPRRVTGPVPGGGPPRDPHPGGGGGAPGS